MGRNHFTPKESVGIEIFQILAGFFFPPFENTRVVRGWYFYEAYSDVLLVLQTTNENRAKTGGNDIDRMMNMMMYQTAYIQGNFFLSGFYRQMAMGSSFTQREKCNIASNKTELGSSPT